MGRAPCCSKVGLHRGSWTAREDALLIQYIQSHGEGHWSSLPMKAGLLRCGKSCRLRWMNYLRPDIKRGNITPEEDDLIVRLHALLGNRWSLIAGRLPGRTDNEIKNYWNTHIAKRLRIQKTSTQEVAPKPKSKCVQAEEAKKSDDDQENIGATTRRTKLHLPKPIRVSPVKTPVWSFCDGEGDHEQEVGFHDSEVPNYFHVSWPDDMKKKDDDCFGEGLVCGENVEDCYDFVQVFDPARNQNSEEAAAAAERVAMTWKICEEYEQDIKADQDHGQLESFVDSLLI
ncbi:unnamed protein product [Prunus armeniaca]|uniref:Uncharacterized protein n=1 Tax=Prunus armeniaca TaxID=36596 RepID=A0A6J5UXS1_PRUAR|nr:unnamed protein product [Prunus armeniaca]CAB4310658.1 unnamed protein product [Prunus armeniaca]